MNLTIVNSSGNIISSQEGRDSIDFLYEGTYNEGDRIIVTSEAESFVTISIDQYIVESIVYLKEGVLDFCIPTGDWKKTYHPKAFEGNQHQIVVYKTPENVRIKRRNIALNGLDKRGEQNYYPHTDPNIVTRDEPWFEGRNAIDGYKDTQGHGPFPFQSWGGGLRDDLEFRLYFGREVIVDEIVLYLRADYENDHDINWETGTIEFSDGSILDIIMNKTTQGQSFRFEPKTIQWIKMNKLRRKVSAAFSALTQIEVMGFDQNKE